MTCAIKDKSNKLKELSKRFMFFGFLFIVFFMPSFGQNKLAAICAENIADPRTYMVYETLQPITIDGKDSELVWQKAVFSEAFVDIEGDKKPKPHYETKVKMLWDKSYLYIYAKLQEEHIWGDIKNRDEVIFHNNDFEVFINPSCDTFAYGEIEINALGTVWDLLLTQPYSRRGKPINSWDIKNLKTAVHIEGTVNNPNDKDSYWAVEMAIPMGSLLELAGRKASPQFKDIWRINFSRVQWQHQILEGVYQRKKVGETYLPEDNWVWTPQKAINMHFPEMWGYMQFAGDINGQKQPFLQHTEVLTEQVAYALYRSILTNNITEIKNTPIGKAIALGIFDQKNQKFEATYVKTHIGFELIVKNLSNHTAYALDTNGFLKKL